MQSRFAAVELLANLINLKLGIKNFSRKDVYVLKNA